MENKLLTDRDKIFYIFDSIKNSKNKLWIWQTYLEKNISKRVIQFGVVKNIDNLKKQIVLSTYKSKKFHFTRGQPLFIFSKENLVAAKINLKTFDGDYLSFSFPESMTIVTKDFFDKINLIEPCDNNKFFAKRCEPRKIVNSEQLACLSRNDGSTEFLSVYDISTGGMSILVDDPGQFLIGERIYLNSIDGKQLQAKVPGEIRNISLLPDNPETFKVGIKLEVSVY